MPLLYFLSLASFFLLGFGLVQWALRRKSAWEGLALSLPVSLALLLGLVGITARIVHRVDTALLAGGALCLAGGLFWIFVFRKRLPSLEWKLRLRWSDLPLLVILAVATGLVVSNTWNFSLSDENGSQGHIAVTQQILEGSYPPSYLAFPEILHKYHYGFNLLAAAISIVFKIPGTRGIEGATWLSWAALQGSLLLCFSALRIPRGLWGLAWLFTLFSGGLFLPGMELSGIPNWQIGYLYGRQLSPHAMVYFFQHPMGLGLSLLLASLYFFREWFERRSGRAWLAGTAVLGALSFAQSTLFLTLLASLGLFFFYRLVRRGAEREIEFSSGLALAILTLALAFALGGVFQFAPGNENKLLAFSWPPGFLRNEFYGRRHAIGPGQACYWYLRSFGLALILAPFALGWAFWKGTALPRLLAIFSVLSFLIAQFFHYYYSWDIIKWLFLSEISARLLIAWAFSAWIASKVWRQALSWGLVLWGTWTPATYLYDTGWKGPRGLSGPNRRYLSEVQVRYPEFFRPIFEFMKSCPSCRRMVWTSDRVSFMVAMHTGYPVLYMEGKLRVMPIQRSYIKERGEALQVLNARPTWELLRSLGIGWVLFSCDEVRKMPEPVRNFLRDLTAAATTEDFSVDQGPQRCYWALRLKE